MSIRDGMMEALQRGEKIKDQFLSGVMNSQAVSGLLQNESVIKSLSKVIHTRYEIERALKTNLRAMFKMFNLPSRDEILTMELKIHRLENEIDGIQQKIKTKANSSSGIEKLGKNSLLNQASAKPMNVNQPNRNFKPQKVRPEGKR